MPFARFDRTTAAARPPQIAGTHLFPSLVMLHPDSLALSRLYHWETHAPTRVVMTQPVRDRTGTRSVIDYTWGQVADEARRMAAHLQSLELPPGSTIALLSKNCAHWLIADLAIWLGGYVSVPLYPTLGPATIGKILSHSGARLVFVGKLDDYRRQEPGIPAHLPRVLLPLAPPDAMGTLWERVVADTPPLTGHPQRDADALATVVYTSGTTGEPKGVMHTFATLAQATESGCDHFEVDASSRMLSFLPLAHVAERALIELALLSRSIHVFFAESLDTFLEDLRRARPTVFFAVPRLWLKFQQGVHAKVPPRRLAMLLRLPLVGAVLKRRIVAGLGLDACRFAICGAAPMPIELGRWYERLGLPVVNAYGMTETAAIAHASEPGRLQPGSVGRPYAGLATRIDTATGEIQMRAPWLMTGYFKDEALTRAAFTEDGWLRSGDRGAIEGGGLFITGRVDELFKTAKGKYVAPTPIEDRLVMHPMLEACCVTGASLGQPLGVVMLSEDAQRLARDAAGRSLLQSSLAAHLQAINAQLDPHERLECIAVVSTPWTVESGFVTPTLKVRRQRIDSAYSTHYAAWSRTRQPVVWA